jgi:hypothetical protein
MKRIEYQAGTLAKVCGEDVAVVMSTSNAIRRTGDAICRPCVFNNKLLGVCDFQKRRYNHYSYLIATKMPFISCYAEGRKDGNHVVFVGVVKGCVRLDEDKQLVIVLQYPLDEECKREGVRNKGYTDVYVWDGEHTRIDREYFLMKTKYVKVDKKKLYSLLSKKGEEWGLPDETLSVAETMVVEYQRRHGVVIKLSSRFEW